MAERETALAEGKGFTEAEIDALALSLRTVGLLQNLAGFQEAEDRIAIVAGGRRWRECVRRPCWCSFADRNRAGWSR